MNYALITGASSGIGKEFAYKLAKNNYSLVLVARRIDKLEEIKESLSEVEIVVIKADLTVKSERQNIFKEINSRNLNISLFINNAGNGYYGSFLDLPLENHEFNIELNITALTELSYEFAKHVINRKILGGHLVNVSSLASYIPLPNYAVYAGTKAYVRFLSEAISYEFKEKGISVTCICPGGTKTEFLDVAGQKVNKRGEMGMMTAKEVVDISYRAIKKKKKVVVTGFLNKIASKLLTIIPKSLAIKIYNSSVEKV